MSRGQGYVGQSMSVNATNAYAEEKEPLSKWTKTKIVKAMLDINWDLDEKLVGRLSKQSLVDEFLEYKEWHHTGKFYQCTDFYGLNENKVEELTNEELKELIIKHTPTEKEKELARTKKAQVQARRAEKRREKQRIAELLDLMAYSKYKNQVWFLRAYDGNEAGIEELKRKKEFDEISKEYRSLEGSTTQLRKYINCKKKGNRIKSLRKRKTLHQTYGKKNVRAGKQHALSKKISSRQRAEIGNVKREVRVLEQFVEMVCEDLRIAPIPLRYDNSVPKSEGRIAALEISKVESTLLILNTDVAELDLLFAIAHELRHAWQFQNRRHWFKNYKEIGEVDFEEYNLQQPEVDANAYATIVMEEVAGMTPQFQGYPPAVKRAIAKELKVLLKEWKA
ncbi:hypothetical protein GCWU000322_00057 [Eubacterium saphenum ATCC 49989]|nr:hypothetical protein GCWU000322_00057 [Eubacterium saphenum ATCC 49989]